MARSSTSRLGFLAVVGVGVALAVAYLSDCRGPGAGGGRATRAPATEAPKPPEDAVPPGDAATPSSGSTLVVVGARCQRGRQPAAPCDEVCAQAVAAGGPVTIDAVSGSHGVVQTLRTCLEDAGAKVRLVSQ